LTSPAMRFYDVRSSDEHFEDVDLNRTTVLFAVFVGQVVVQRLVTGKLSPKAVVPSEAPLERYWIKPHLRVDPRYRDMPLPGGGKGGYPFVGGDLKDLGQREDSDTYQAPVAQANLWLPEDRAVIEAYELTNMWGADNVRDRLCRYFDTGVNRDDTKGKVFPGLYNK
jgi:hypothetical protein